jgi:tetratricopeptide (TPR) repeat protein
VKLFNFQFLLFSWARLVALAIFVFAKTVFAADLSPEFDSANKLYEQGKFSDAAAGYEKIVQSRSVSSALYFNLGNAYFKSSHVGRAIAAYREAEKLSPRDPDIRANLQFARNQVQNPTLPPDQLHRWLGRLSVNEWTTLAAIALWLCLLPLTIMQVRPALQRSFRSLAIASGVATIVLSCCVAAVLPSRSTQSAVIITPEAIIRSGPLDEAPQSFIAHDGAELSVLDTKDNWLQVTTGPRHGWIKAEQVLLVQ